jgi:Fe-S-cluster containining protein
LKDTAADTRNEGLLSVLEQAYRELENRTRALDGLLEGRLRCRRGCCACCLDGLTVYEVEAEHIRRHCQSLLAAEKPHPEGACAFLDHEGACRIYEHRPYVCRTQGYPLRWIEEREDGTAVEMRDICPLNDAGTPVERLPEEECWTIGPFEERLARLQLAADGGRMTRTRLRDLFR